MKSRLITFVILILGFFTLIFLFYYILVVKPQIKEQEVSQETKILKEKRAEELVEARLAYVDLNKLDPKDANFYENYDSDLKVLADFSAKSEAFFNDNRSNLLSSELIKKDNQVSTQIEGMSKELSEKDQELGKILSYDHKSELAPLMEKKQYDRLLGLVQKTREGLSQYKNNAALKPEITQTLDILTSLENSLQSRNYSNLNLLLTEYQKSYTLLKKKSYREISSLIREKKSVEMLTNWTNLIISYQN